MASYIVYHQSYSIRFRLGRYPDEDFYETTAKKRNTVSGDFYIKRENAFLQAVIYLQEMMRNNLQFQI